MTTNAEKTRRYRERRYAEIAAMPRIPCACGCGTLIPPVTRKLVPAQFAKAHHFRVRGRPELRGKPSWNRGGKAPWAVATHTGRKRTPEAIAKRTAARRAAYGGAYAPPGKTLTETRDPEKWRKRMAELGPLNRRFGPDNHFFGRTHTPEVRAKISEKKSGERNPAWRGGVSTLPYGPEFTRKFKRLIRDRDGHVCQSCGKAREQHHRALEVHHIDHDKFNNDPTNLITVCGSCNVWYSYHRDTPFTVMGRAH